jgi:TM2 domain-containing membrane protein YozV
MGIRAGAVALLCLTSTAVAQPGPDQQQQGPYAPPPQQPGPYAPPAPPAQPYAPPPQPGYGPPQQGNYYAPTPQQYAVQITEEERDILMKGEIDGTQIALGGLGAIFFGFGVGQAIQGRWSENGWIFTFGEIGAFSILIAGAIDSANDRADERDNGFGFMIAGALAFSVLRVWESVDAFTGPAGHNRRVRELRMRVGYGGYPGYYGMTPYVTPTADGGGTAGLSLRF